MSGRVDAYDILTDTLEWSVGLEDGSAVSLHGEVPDQIKEYECVQFDGSQPLTAADGEPWLESLALRLRGYLWGEYVPEGETDESREVRWKNPDDAAKHPKYPKGAEGGKGGQWAPKGEGGDYYSLTDEQQAIHELLATGAIEHLMTLTDAGITGGINSYDCAVATIEGQQVFVKRGSDVSQELAASLVNHLMGDMVAMPEMVGRSFWWRDGRPGTYDEHDHKQLLYSSTDDGKGKPTMFAVMQAGSDGHPLEVSRSPYSRADLEDIAVFDAVTANWDRHPWNLIRRASDGRPVLIDHGYCFDPIEMYNRVGEGLHDFRAGIEDYVRKWGHPLGSDIPELRLEPHHRKALTSLVSSLSPGSRARKELASFIGAQRTTKLVERAQWMLDHDTILIFSPDVVPAR